MVDNSQAIDDLLTSDEVENNRKMSAKHTAAG